MTPFVTRSGRALLAGGRPWGPFAGCNFAWLGLDHPGHWSPPPPGGTAFPSRRRVDDGYAAAAAMGCQVVRGYSLMPTFGHANSVFPDAAAARAAAANEAAMAVQDYAIARARDYGLRVLPVLCDRYEYYVGSQAQWSHALGGDGTQAGFYHDPTVRAGWLACVRAWMTRRNRLTGVRYCDDPTVLGWETGNEIGPPPGWTPWVCAELKAVAPRHLTVDGRFVAVDGWDPTASHDPNVDVLGNHYYPLSVGRLHADVTTAAGFGKPFVTLEWDWNNNRGGDPLAAFLGALVARRAEVAGAGWWALAAHADESGWANANNYVGQDGLPYDVLPGLTPKGDQLRRWAYEFRGRTPPAWPVPGITRLTAAPGGLVWRGAAGGGSYTVERSADGRAWGPAHVGLTADDCPWPVAAGWGYRVRAVSPDGAAGHPSNVVTVG